MWWYPLGWQLANHVHSLPSPGWIYQNSMGSFSSSWWHKKKYIANCRTFVALILFSSLLTFLGIPGPSPWLLHHTYHLIIAGPGSPRIKTLQYAHRGGVNGTACVLRIKDDLICVAILACRQVCSVRRTPYTAFRYVDCFGCLYTLHGASRMVRDTLKYMYFHILGTYFQT